MKLYLLIFILAITAFVNANGLKISNSAIAEMSSSNGILNVKFDLYWENSWRCDINSTIGYAEPYNHDAVWVFLKYKNKNNQWQHIYLPDNNDFVVKPDSSQIESARDSVNSGVIVPGFFIYRNSNGSGINDWKDITLKLNLSNLNITDTTQLSVKIYAIEMVYVPESKFYLGSGGNERDPFYIIDSSNSKKPYLVNSEDSITVATTDSSLYYDTQNSYTKGDQSGPIPKLYPKGYKAFYCMKHEITQAQYTDFLNSLTRTQQAQHVRATITSTNITNVYVMGNKTTAQSRNGIKCNKTQTTTDPINFYCDLNANSVPNEANDGMHLPSAYLNWGDITAYSDWAGLRPMTELEFEKACRGSVNPLSNEYTWGSTDIVQTTAISSGGLESELSSTTNANCLYNYSTVINGPIRTGCHATANSNRELAGSTYYGIMQMSGNLLERVISAGNIKGRSFTGLHGNGELNTTGQADTENWPTTDATGSGFRGGSWHSTILSELSVSDRYSANYASPFVYGSYGGRLVRTSEVKK